MESVGCSNVGEVPSYMVQSLIMCCVQFSYLHLVAGINSLNTPRVQLHSSTALSLPQTGLQACLLNETKNPGNRVQSMGFSFPSVNFHPFRGMEVKKVMLDRLIGVFERVNAACHMLKRKIAPIIS